MVEITLKAVVFLIFPGLTEPYIQLNIIRLMYMYNKNIIHKKYYFL